MESHILPILLFMGGAALLTVGMLAVGSLFGPKRTTAVKEMPYESGMDPIHDARKRFDVRFHLVAIAFLIFDVELLFLYPWAVVYRDMLQTDPNLIFGAMISFLGILFIGYIYALKKGAFDWKS